MATTEETTQPATPAARDAARPSSVGTLKPPGTGYSVKRTVLGKPIPTAHLIHERLGKAAALAVFSSDALSSVAYATEEMLKVLLIAGVGAAMFSLIMPISAVIVGVLAILIFSYRQTIKAYPSAGGAYIVTKDNFGVLPAQIAGVALLTDYVLTVAVSISAGVAAIVSVQTELFPFRVPLALMFLGLLMWGNLRGVRESGRLFAAPTFIFIFGVGSLLLLGAWRLATGQLQPLAHPALPPAGGSAGLLAGVGAFVVLRALASGSTAMTGVEAISNGVPAFRPPEARNARNTLLTMGVILGTMFLGISFLAHRLQVVPDLTERRTVLSMIAKAVYGTSALGHTAFLVLQVATMAILVLAANTSFADFPRLASFQAGDSFLPRQFTRRGHRLVFSNGIIALAAAAGLLIVLFQANVTRLIPFYAIGVFTSFSMSQAGMAKRHWRLREPGWRLGIAINGAGAIATGIVLIVVSVTKFMAGAWVVMLVVPLVVVLLTRMNGHYERERLELEEDLPRFRSADIPPPTAVLLVEDLDRAAIHALQYAKTMRVSATHAVHFTRDGADVSALQARWNELGIDVPLEIVTDGGSLPEAVAEYVAGLPGEGDVNVIVPRPADITPFERLRRGRIGTVLTHALLPDGRARVTLVRDHHGPGHSLMTDPDGRTRLRLAPRTNHRVIVLVDKADRATLRAVRYALSLGADEVRAVHAAVDHDNQEALIARWMELGLPVKLDVIECWDRNVARSLEGYVVELMRGRAEVTVVMPRRDYEQLRQRILHDRTSRKIADSLGRYEHVDLAVVPFYFDKPRGTVTTHPHTLE